MVEAVQGQIDDLGVADARPGLVAIAVALAGILDNPNAVPQHSAAAGRLVEILGKLSHGVQRPGRLAAVKAMTARGPSA